MQDETKPAIIEAEATALIPTTDIQQRVDMMLANRDYIVQMVKPKLIEGVDIYTLPNMKKPSLGKPGAEKLAAIFGMTAKFEVDRETMEVIGAEANGKKYIAYICNLSRSGRVAGQGRGASFIDWMRNSYRMIFQEEYNRLTGDQKETCQGPLQGKSKSTGNPYTYWRIPEPPVFDNLALNKAIKMAQKSAFVDAVIRTTGMSDLFTQDLEDMANAPEAPQSPTNEGNAPDEPFQGTPSYERPPAKPSPQAKREVDALDVAGMACDRCGKPMKKRNGARGPFWGCSGYPDCNNIKNV